MRVPAEWPIDSFDLIVFSEVLYFMSAADIAACAQHACDSLPPAGMIVLVNWLGKTDDPSSADTAPDHLLEATNTNLRVVAQERHKHYRLDLLTSA